MYMKAMKLNELQNFCNEQFKLAEGEDAKLLSADEVKRITNVRNIANDAVKEYDELVKNYQDLLKDYQELVKHSGSPDKTPEVENPAGSLKSGELDINEFKKEFLKHYKEQ